jgi:hypothetical protein
MIFLTRPEECLVTELEREQQSYDKAKKRKTYNLRLKPKKKGPHYLTVPHKTRPVRWLYPIPKIVPLTLHFLAGVRSHCAFFLSGPPSYMRFQPNQTKNSNCKICHAGPFTSTYMNLKYFSPKIVDIHHY